MIEAAEIDEIKPGKMKRITTDREAVLLCNVGGEYYAVADLCTHEDFSLSYGCLKGHDVECSLHGARFDVRTGQPTEEPAELPVKTYPVILRDSKVWVDID